MSKRPTCAPRGRGARSSPDNRYALWQREEIDDGWSNLEQPCAPLRTTLSVDTSRTVIAYNRSPDVDFDRSINPYRGCEHGCVYCFARPTHAYLGLSPGLDFESRLFYKPEAAALLRDELAKPGYQCRPIAVGINTDAYQPVERQLELTRGILGVLRDVRHPCTLVTKSAMVERDLDLITELAEHNLVHVMVSLTTLQPALARRLEPRAAAPHRRLETVRVLSSAGIPTGVLVAPLIPVLTDAELEQILEQARAAGAAAAGYVLLRLPHELKDLFTEWLQEHAPDQAQRVMNRLRESRGGRAYDARFGVRMRGTGIYADLLAQRFQLARRRLGYAELPGLDCTLFRPPAQARDQLALF